MSSEVWFRNVKLYMRELVECQETNLVLDAGTIVKSRIHFPRYMDLFYPSHLAWKCLVPDDAQKIVREYSAGSGASILDTHPFWDAEEDTLRHLETLMATSKRVMVNVPGMNSDYKNQIMEELADIQRDYPDCKLHLHNASGFQRFSYNFGAVDIDARGYAAVNKLYMPDGTLTLNASMRMQPGNKWLRVLGFNASDMIEPRQRCMFNIKSAKWAGEHFNENVNLRSRKTVVDYSSPNAGQTPVKHAKVALPRDPEKRAGNYFLCNACGLQSKCDFFRQGAVCSVPNSEPTDLAKYFGSRDSGTIISGLSTLLQFQSNRLMEAARQEDESGEIDPELTKMVNTLFDRGVKMAKLIDPTLSNPKVGIFMGSGVPSPGVGANVNPKQLMANIVAELEGRGIKREDITPEMIQNILSNVNPNQVIEAVAISSKTESD